MKKGIMNEPSEVYISAIDLENANLNEWESLELHLLDQAAAVIPGRMTVMEVIRTAYALQGLASDLLTAVGTACEKCDRCHVEMPCDLMKNTTVCPEISIPRAILEEADLDPDYKLACEVDPESGHIQIVEADYRYDLTDLPEELLDTFRECNICLDDLEKKIWMEEIIYGRAEEKEF